MRKNRNVRVRGIRRGEPDIRKLGRALIELAQAQAEKEAQAEYHAKTSKSKPTKPPKLRRSSDNQPERRS